MSNLFSNLKTLRRNRNIPLREIEKVTGISNAYMSQIESGKVKNPSVFIIHKLAIYYKLSVEGLINAKYQLIDREALNDILLNQNY